MSSSSSGAPPSSRRGSDLIKLHTGPHEPRVPVRTLLENPHMAVTLDAEAGVVRLVRFETAFASLEEAVRIMESALVIAGQESGARRALLLDFRRAPGRNDPEFERASSHLIAHHLRGFARAAVLARTAVGKLQVQRVAREVGKDPSAVFHSEEEALAYLRAGLA